MSCSYSSELDYEWNCPSCTYTNRAGSFKCDICSTPKGTATRQVRLHQSTIEQRYVAETFRSGSKSLHGSGAGKKRTRSKVSSVVGGGSSGVGSSSSTATTSSTSAIGSSSIASGGAVDVTSDICKASGASSTASSTCSSSSVTSASSAAVPLAAAALPGRSKIYIRGSNAASANKRITRSKLPKLSNINRSSGVSNDVTFDSVTVTITEYDSLYSDSDS